MSNALQRKGSAALLRMARKGLTEAITFNLIATSGATASDKTVRRVRVESPDYRQVDGIEVLETDKIFRIAVADISFTPTRWSTITRTDSTVWQVQSIRGGDIYPFWLIQARQRG